MLVIGLLPDALLPYPVLPFAWLDEGITIKPEHFPSPLPEWLSGAAKLFCVHWGDLAVLEPDSFPTNRDY